MFKFEDLPNIMAENNRLLCEVKELLEVASKPQQAPNELMSIKEASKHLNLAIATIYSMTSKKELPYCKRGKKLYFNREELSEYVRSGKRLTNDEVKTVAVRKAAQAMTKGSKHRM